jgi:exonuclease SbcC
MRIEKIELENIKPFKKQTFIFSKGINVLSGPNGSGKSTVFEAIGYALFGVPASQFIGNSDRFVRKGQKKGRVRIHFTTSEDQGYAIERSAGANAKWFLCKRQPDESLEMMELKDDELRSTIKKLLNLRGDQPIDKQFLNVIGPLQNDFLGPFTKKGTQRSEEFDRILDIDSWREAFRRSREIESKAEDTIKSKEQLITSKTTQVASYDATVDRLKSAEQRHGEAFRVVAQITEQLAQIRRQEEELSALDRALHEQQKTIDHKNATLIGLQASLKGNKENLSKAHSAKAICDSALEGYGAYERAEQHLAKLKDKQTAALSLDKEIHSADKEIATLRARIETKEKHLQEKEQQTQARREQRRAELTEAEKWAHEYNSLHERAVEDFKKYDQFGQGFERIEKPSNIRDRILRSIDDLAKSLNEAAAQQQRLQDKPAVDALAHREKELATECADIKERLLTLQARRQQLEEGNLKLADGLCPFFKEKCMNLMSKGMAPTNFFAQQIEALQHRETEIGQQLQQVRADFEAAQKAAKESSRLNEVELQLKTISERVKHDRIQLDLHLAPLLPGGSLWERIWTWVQSAPTIAYGEELKRQCGGVFDFQPRENLTALKMDIVALIERYDGLLTKLKRVADERRTALDNAARKANADLAAAYQKIDEIRKDERRIEEDLRSIARERSELDVERGKLEAKIKESEIKKAKALEYKDLDAEIKKQEETRAVNREQHTNFLRYQEDARAVADLENKNAVLLHQTADLGQELAELTQQLEILKSSYDKRAHNEIQKQAQSLEGQRGSLSSELKNLAAEIIRLQAEKAHMESIAKEIKELSTEIKAYKKTLSFIKDLRGKVLKEVSEKLSQRFREEIGQIADRIYRIISRSDEELRWGEGYNVMLVDLQDGQERVRYDEELSGGQMMSAVVALRLALLQTSGSRMGFFDEPTSNLDEARRLNLVQAFRSLDAERGAARQPWYEQLFLISHDVTFTEITDQTIHFLDPGVVLNETADEHG